MAVKSDYLQWVVEQLAGLERVTARPMFGGVGLYHDAVFFALIMADVLYFKVDDATRGEYATRGMRQFRPYRDKPHVSMNYYEVPADVLEDAELCVAWARGALNAAMTAKPPRTRCKPKRLPALPASLHPRRQPA